MKTESEINSGLRSLLEQEENCTYCTLCQSHPSFNPHWPRQGKIKALKWVLEIEKDKDKLQ